MPTAVPCSSASCGGRAATACIGTSPKLEHADRDLDGDGVAEVDRRRPRGVHGRGQLHWNVFARPRRPVHALRRDVRGGRARAAERARRRQHGGRPWLLEPTRRSNAAAGLPLRTRRLRSDRRAAVQARERDDQLECAGDGGLARSVIRIASGVSDTGRNKTVVTAISKISDRPVAKEACLVVIYGLELGKKFNLNRPQIIIGRSSKADIQIDQEAVSRNHCKIINTGNAIMLRDMGSTNGTYVNDEMIDEYVLRDGDFIKVGRCIFKFLSGNNIENAYHEEIYRLTTVDGLTQVFNRRYFVETLEREIGRALRYRRDLSLIMFDIDQFKNVNDTLRPPRRRPRAQAPRERDQDADPPRGRASRATAARSSRSCCPRSITTTRCSSPRRSASSSRSPSSSSRTR